jgi:arylsulfatase
VLQVPLVVRWDGEVPAGRRVSEIVSIRDIPATLASLAGVSLPTGFPGVSLAPLWGDSSAARALPSAAISELTQDPVPRTSDPLSRSQGVSLVDPKGEHGLHRAAAGARTWLYDVRRDRAETQNLTVDADGAARHREQRRILQALLREDETRHSRR